MSRSLISHCTNPMVPNFRLYIGLFKLLLTGLLLFTSRTHSEEIESKANGRQIDQKTYCNIPGK